jgi:hypothetical protein
VISIITPAPKTDAEVSVRRVLEYTPRNGGHGEDATQFWSKRKEPEPEKNHDRFVVGRGQASKSSVTTTTIKNIFLKNVLPITRVQKSQELKDFIFITGLTTKNIVET